ncbi:hypothetical protein IAQ61_011246 [Plenodomus lingam]|uniref:uncharacterized protein n=1 Tax=Leptosphaeria maculans TaxID=5022 RepID=UPI00332DFECE|nr:hypothetical protein IAQ61_011246 [Plenodomus lingam]
MLQELRCLKLPRVISLAPPSHGFYMGNHCKAYTLNSPQDRILPSFDSFHTRFHSLNQVESLLRTGGRTPSFDME